MGGQPNNLEDEDPFVNLNEPPLALTLAFFIVVLVVLGFVWFVV